jgi:hypothetical protein
MHSTPSETPVELTGQGALVPAAGAQVAVTARTAAQVAETVQLIEHAGGGAHRRVLKLVNY